MFGPFSWQHWDLHFWHWGVGDLQFPAPCKLLENKKVKPERTVELYFPSSEMLWHGRLGLQSNLGMSRGGVCRFRWVGVGGVPWRALDKLSLLYHSICTIGCSWGGMLSFLFLRRLREVSCWRGKADSINLGSFLSVITLVMA